MINFEGCVAVITGGASGIGLAIARSFASRGCKVMLLDVERAPLDAVVAELRKAGSNANVRGTLCDARWARRALKAEFVGGTGSARRDDASSRSAAQQS